MKKQVHVFGSAVAQYQNLGDAVLRRQMIELMPAEASIHLLTSGMPASYVDFVVQGAGCRSVQRYATGRQWIFALLGAVVKRGARVIILYSPGPQNVDGGGGRAAIVELLRLVLNSFVRIAGGRVVRPGRSYEGGSRASRILARLAIASAHYSSHRDLRQAWVQRAGSQFHPDVALSWQGEWEAERFEQRKLMAVSLRYDRRHDLRQIADRVGQLAAASGLSPVVVSQVSFDHVGARALADELGCEAFLLDPDFSNSADALMDIYGRCKAVLSDRLHVLIFSAIQGACPVILNPDANPKVEAAMKEIVPICCALTVGAETPNMQFFDPREFTAISRDRVSSAHLDLLSACSFD